MIQRLTFTLLLLLALLAAAPHPTAAENLPQPHYSAWRPLSPGIAYREFYLDGPNRVYVARLERANPAAFIDSSIGQGKLSGGSETVRAQAERYNDAISYWDRHWGARSQVVVAINGSFFDTNTGVPWSGQIQSGWYAKRFADRQRSSGFVWTLDRQAFIGTCVINPPAKQQIRLLASGKSLTFDDINVPRPESGLVIYSSHYDAATPARDAGQKLLEVLVELSQPLTILPAPAQVEGVVRQVQDGEGGLPIPFDHIVLSATGKAYSELKNTLQPDDRIGISQELRHLQPGCREPNPHSWTNAFASVAGSYIFLRDGAVQPEGDLGAVLKNPRTAVAVNDKFVFFIVVDGRQPMTSLGMSMVELGVFARTRLGASDGIALDGGGSSTMVVNGQVMNVPNPETDEPRAGETSLSTSEGATPRVAKVERVVANGLMMVAGQPKKQSSRFKPGDALVIQDTSDVNVRLGPGVNYAILTALPSGSRGVVLEHALNGVLATGYSWWKIDFAGIVGWVNENSLAGP